MTIHGLNQKKFIASELNSRRGNLISNSSQNLIRYALGMLLAFSALNAFAGGYYGISGAKDVPTEWLKGSPIHDYFIPGFILFIVVGGSFLFAAIAVFARMRFARLASFCSVGVVFVWLAVQIAIIGYVSWMQPTTAAVGFVILILTWLLPKQPKQAY
jgi:hypothetical protein